MSRDILTSGCCKVFPSKLDVATRRLAQPSQCMHRQRLARAVLPKHGQHLAATDIEFERINEIAARNVDPQVVAGKKYVAGLAHKLSVAYSDGQQKPRQSARLISLAVSGPITAYLRLLGITESSSASAMRPPIISA